MAFTWNIFRLLRLRSAVRAFNRTITMRERELAAQGTPELTYLLPERVTVEGVKERVKNVNDFRRIVGYSRDIRRGRSSELSRILKKYDPNALQFEPGHRGEPTTRYANREYWIDTSAIRRQRAKERRIMETPLHEGDVLNQDYASMSDTEYMNAMNNNDLGIGEGGEPDASVEDMDNATLQRWEQEDAKRKRDTMLPHARLDTYLGEWHNPMNGHALMGDYEEVVSALEWMRDVRPDVSIKMFNSGADEVEVAYLIDSGGKKNPYNNIPIETRHARTVKFVTTYARKCGWNG